MAEHPAGFSYDSSTDLYLFTSLTAGSSHIITATSRLETILKANRVPFKAVDCATDEKARRIWGRRAGNKKLPGLVREGIVLADLAAVEEWNEYGELKEQLGVAAPATGAEAAKKENAPISEPAGAASYTTTLPIRTQQPEAHVSFNQQSNLAAEAAAMAAQRKKNLTFSSLEASPSATSAPIPTTDTSTKTHPISATIRSSASERSSPSHSPSRRAQSPANKSPESSYATDLDSHLHNTSTAAALPPLSTSLKPSPTLSAVGAPARSATDSAIPDTDLGEELFPKAPPSTAISPDPPVSMLSRGRAATEPLGIDDSTNSPMFSPTSNPSSDPAWQPGAGLAMLAEQHANTSASAPPVGILRRSDSTTSNASAGAGSGTLSHHRNSSIDLKPSPEDVLAAEQANAIEEVDEADGASEGITIGGQGDGKAAAEEGSEPPQRVKFDEGGLATRTSQAALDELKGHHGFSKE